MNAGTTAERVYAATKQLVLSGRIHPGERIDPTLVAGEVLSSVTPVRDALHRLVGERLVETRPTEGFHLPLVTEAGMRDLLRWHADLLRLALRRSSGSAIVLSAPGEGTDRLDETQYLFAAIAARSADTNLIHAVGAANDRLRTSRHAENGILTGLDDELAALERTASQGDDRGLLHGLRQYHRRRQSMVPRLVVALYAL